LGLTTMQDARSTEPFDPSRRIFHCIVAWGGFHFCRFRLET
jgi:hypothetical protein